MLPILQAFAEGRKIEYLDKDNWHSCGYIDLINYEPHEYRIKPEPTYRPFKPEEIPIGALIRWKSEVREQMTGRRGFDVTMIIGVHCYRALTGVYACNFTPETLLRCHEISLDQGKTWQPAGVLE